MNEQLRYGENEEVGTGDFVLNSQEVAKDDGFSRVSRIWYNQTMSFDEGIEKLQEQQKVINDIECTLKEMQPSVLNDGRFGFKHSDGEEFSPTPFALKRMAASPGMSSSWFYEHLTSPLLKPNSEEVMRERDSIDSRILAAVVENDFRHIDRDKVFNFRTWKDDNTLRVMVTDKYAVINNEWFLETLKELIPGGRLSHWRGNADTIYGNVLIPDTIIEDEDSDYGGLLSIGNSEIGERALFSRPSIFRAICMNGCIWGEKKGDEIRIVHRGNISLEDVKGKIEQNLTRQIPLLPAGIARLLGLRNLKTDVAMKPIVAVIAKDYSFGKKQANRILEHLGKERNVRPDTADSLFGVVNAITRAGQTYENSTWFDFDRKAGALSELDADDWGTVVNRAKRLSVEEVEKRFHTPKKQKAATA